MRFSTSLVLLIAATVLNAAPVSFQSLENASHRSNERRMWVTQGVPQNLVEGVERVPRIGTKVVGEVQNAVHDVTGAVQHLGDAAGEVGQTARNAGQTISLSGPAGKAIDELRPVGSKTQAEVDNFTVDRAQDGRDILKKFNLGFKKA
ncbi:hypothetical protein FRB99_002113 [Tulasnella sp. 403]|nr:hypothetical protein FRB99_002113 [Tulasnella sp. 403]